MALTRFLFSSKNEIALNQIREENLFLYKIVSHLGTCLTVPEEEIIEQGDKGQALFFISKGDCAVKYLNINGHEVLSSKLLTEGDHFGEISMIYKCPRTATVISRNYNTLARLTYEMYREIVNEYPDYLRYLKLYLFGYKEAKKYFFFDMITSIEYFNHNFPVDLLHDMFYSMETKKYE